MSLADVVETSAKHLIQKQQHHLLLLPGWRSDPPAQPDKPAANQNQPAANSQQPTASSQQPATNSHQPTANQQQLTAQSQQTTASSQQPAARSERGRLRARADDHAKPIGHARLITLMHVCDGFHSMSRFKTRFLDSNMLLLVLRE